MRLFLGIAAAAMIQGCVFYPRTTTVHDEECGIQTRHMTLQGEPFGHVASCTGKECTAMLAIICAVTAGSAVVSGSIVVAGNVVYWMERRGKCAARDLDFHIITAPPLLSLFHKDPDVLQEHRATIR